MCAFKLICKDYLSELREKEKQEKDKEAQRETTPTCGLNRP